MSLSKLRADLKHYWRPEKADFLQKYFFAKNGKASKQSFSTSKDIFRGVSVPNSRLIAKKYKDLQLTDIAELLKSKVHEEKLIAIIILTIKYEKGTEQEQLKVVEFYLNNTEYINNWDLVDTGAYKILGNYLLDKPKDFLYTLAKSEKWWERRIAIIATLELIKHQQYEDTFKISEMLLEDKHDLIHKAVGWMLREVGEKCGQKIEESFLQKNYKKMPRTMLRYSIEKFPEKLRLKYLKGEI